MFQRIVAFVAIVLFSFNVFSQTAEKVSPAAETKPVPEKKKIKALKKKKPLVRNYEVFINEAGQFDVLGGVVVITGNTESNGVSNESSGSISAAQVGYGFSPLLNVYLRQNYHNYASYSTSSTSGSSVKGFGNTVLGVKGLMNFNETFSLHYTGAYSSALLDKASIDVTNNVAEITGVNERPSFTAGAIAIVDMETFSFGGGANYSLHQEGKSDVVSTSGTTTSTYRGGSSNSFQLFGQLERGWKLGLIYLKSDTGSYEVVDGSGSSSDREAISSSTYAIYTIIPWSNLEVIGTIFKPSDVGNIKSNLYYGELSLRARF